MNDWPLEHSCAVAALSHAPSPATHLPESSVCVRTNIDKGRSAKSSASYFSLHIASATHERPQKPAMAGENSLERERQGSHEGGAQGQGSTLTCCVCLGRPLAERASTLRHSSSTCARRRRSGESPASENSTTQGASFAFFLGREGFRRTNKQTFSRLQKFEQLKFVLQGVAEVVRYHTRSDASAITSERRVW